MTAPGLRKRLEAGEFASPDPDLNALYRDLVANCDRAEGLVRESRAGAARRAELTR